jgi:hypothetical protein
MCVYICIYLVDLKNALGVFAAFFARTCFLRSYLRSFGVFLFRFCLRSLYISLYCVTFSLHFIRFFLPCLPHLLDVFLTFLTEKNVAKTFAQRMSQERSERSLDPLSVYIYIMLVDVYRGGYYSRELL